MKERFIGGLSAVAALVLACGCTSPMFEGTIFEDTHPKRQQQENQRMLAQAREQSDQNRQMLQDQIEALNMSLGRLEKRVQQLETTVQRQGANDESAALRRDVGRMQEELRVVKSEVQRVGGETQRLRADQGKIRQEVTSDIVSRVEKIAARQNGAPAAAAQPASSAGAANRGGGYEHTVAKGQTLTEIAKGYGTTVQAIMKANKLSNASAIRVGQKLFVPDPQ